MHRSLHPADRANSLNLGKIIQYEAAMARRSDHSRQELKDLVVATATRIIADQGLRALTARKIAVEIGYSPGTIYNVVETLDELIATVNTRTMQALKAELDETSASGDTIADIRQILKTYMGFQSRHPKLWAANIEHAGREDLEQPAFYVAELEAVLNSVETFLAPAFVGRSEADVRRAVRVLWASLQGISAISPSAKFLQEGLQSPAAMAEDLVVTYVRGATIT